MGKEQELILAAQTGNLVQIDKILGQRAKKSGPLQSIRKSVGPNCQDSNGYTPLHHAALNGRRDAVEALLKYEASTNIPDFAGNYPLHLAAWNGHADVAELLLNRGPSRANVNEQNNNNETALHLACQYGHNKVIVVLLECNADPYVRNLNHESALDLGAQYGRLEAVNFLLMYFPALVKKTVSTHTPIHLASRNGHYDIVKSLIDKGMSASLESDDGTPLHVAALYGKSSIVKLLLQSGVDINKRDTNGQTVMDLLAANPSQRSSEITAWLYTHIQNEQQSSLFGGKSRTLSEAINPNHLGYDSIPPPRPMSEYGGVPSNYVPSHYDEVPPLLSLRGATSIDESCNTAMISRQASYDEVPKPRSVNGSLNSYPSKGPTRIASSPASYDFVPPPRQMFQPGIPVESTYGIINRPQSLNISSRPCEASVNNASRQDEQPVRSTYGMINRTINCNETSSTSTQIRGGLNQPVHSTYSIVTQPNETAKPRTQQRGSSCPPSTERQGKNMLSSQSVTEPSRNPSILATRDSSEKPAVLAPRKGTVATNLGLAADSSYEFVELPWMNSPTQNKQSTPISIPSHDCSIPRVMPRYETPVRQDPVGAPGPISIDKQAAGSISNTLSEIRGNPEGAKKQELQHSPTKVRVPEYENIALPLRKGTNSEKEGIYENMPLSSPSYEYHVPRPQPRSSGSMTISPVVEKSRPFPIKDEHRSQCSSIPLSSASWERRTRDYENVELPYQGSSDGRRILQRSHSANESLPPHTLHSSTEPENSKPGTQDRVRPPLPKPYRDTRKEPFHIADEMEDEYCTLREALAGVASPVEECTSPYPPFSPPSPTTASDVLISAFGAHTERDSAGSDETSKNSDCVDGNSQAHARTLKYENIMFDKPSPTGSSGESCNKTDEGLFSENFRLSSVSDGPMNEQEEWKKIERFMNSLGREIGEERKEAEHTTSEVGTWLSRFGLGLYESYLLSNGFDDLGFLAAGILEEQDLLQMGVLDPVYRKTILDHVAQLAAPPRVGVNGFEPKTVEEWLSALHLEEYLDLFYQKGYDSMGRIKQLWELELESILGIHSLGHRKRILASLPELKRCKTMVVSAEDIKQRLAEIDVFGGEQQECLDVVNPGIYEWKTASLEHPQCEKTSASKSQKVQQVHQPQSGQRYEQQYPVQAGKDQPPSGEREFHPSHEQQEQEMFSSLMQQQQETYGASDKQGTADCEQNNGNTRLRRQPSLSPHWNHPPEALLKGNVNYTTKYLGSHFIKDVIGESSTVQACRKMRMSTQKLQKIPAVILSISVTGVRFIDARSRIVISSHYIHNISYCTQDLEDRSVLAYIAKDQKANAHYCHVFKANSPAISDEIVMTLGQAFELAFEQYSRSQYTSGQN